MVVGFGGGPVGLGGSMRRGERRTENCFLSWEGRGPWRMRRGGGVGGGGVSGLSNYQKVSVVVFHPYSSHEVSMLCDDRQVP